MTMKQVPYAVVQDFTPVALVAKAPLSVAIAKDLPITDIKSLFVYAKANPGRMTFAVGSIGSAGHLATELLKRAGGIEYTVVPYKGTAPAFQDLLGGRIDGFIDPILGSLQYHKAGQLRVVAVTSATRTPNLPEVPTVAETIPGFEFYSWYGLWGPAKLPEDIRVRLNTEVNKALASDLREKFTPQGLLLTPGSIDDFVKFQRDDMARSQKIITDGNITCRVKSSHRNAIAGLQVVVTGSSAGIGRAIAERLLALGCVVHGLDRAPATLAAPLFHPTTVDLTDGTQTLAAAHALALAQADALVHAAGLLRVGPLGTLDHAAGELMWRVHVDAAARLADALVPAMAERGRGRVVLIGSRVAQGMPGRGQYAATKAALVGAGAKLGARSGAERCHDQRRVAGGHRDLDAR